MFKQKVVDEICIRISSNSTQLILFIFKLVFNLISVMFFNIYDFVSFSFNSHHYLYDLKV